MNHEVHFITKNFGQYDPDSIDSYLKIGGFSALKKAVTMDGEDIASAIAAVKVKGRGGAAYDMGRKWSQARAVKGEHKVVICNADEGEPCTFKDRELITQDPFNLIEGMVIGGYTVKAQDGYIYMREEYRHLRPRLLNAIRQAEERGFLGKNILGTDFEFHIHLYSGAGAYVCGEGTALIRSIEGKAGRPRMKPPFIKVSGLFALPTCVNNVESFSIVPHLLLDEKHEYGSYGSGESIGTKLVSVGGNVVHPGVFEIPFGTTIHEIIYDLAGGLQAGSSASSSLAAHPAKSAMPASSTPLTAMTSSKPLASPSAPAPSSSSMTGRACSTSCVRPRPFSATKAAASARHAGKATCTSAFSSTNWLAMKPPQTISLP